MSEPDSKEPGKRFDAAMKVILSVSKPAVLAEEKRQKEHRKTERAARKAHRPA